MPISVGLRKYEASIWRKALRNQNNYNRTVSLKEQQNFLARLYTDEALRRRFFAGPAIVGAEFGLTPAETEELAAVLPEELDFFAQSLYWKRLREVEKLLPLTRRVVGADFKDHFRAFADGFNPGSVKKHLEDALAFAEFLETREINDYGRAAARFEGARLAFFGYERRLVWRRLAYDAREIAAAAENGTLDTVKKRMKIAVWVRYGQRIRHFFI